MLDANRIEAIRQAKINALCGKITNTNALHSLQKKSNLVDYLGYAIPAALLVATVVVLRLHLPELAFVVIADILGGILLIGSLVKTSYAWQDKINRHTKLLSDNIDLVRAADSLLARQKTASTEAADLFLEKAAEIEKQDLNMFGTPPEQERQETYRLALREFGQNSTCACGACPGIFRPEAVKSAVGRRSHSPKPRTQRRMTKEYRMTAVEALKEWFNNLNKNQQEEVISFLYGDTVVREGRYFGPAPSIVLRSKGLYCGPPPSASQLSDEYCPTCGKRR
jgi:mobilome CxxCx(11)CxxC protein